MMREAAKNKGLFRALAKPFAFAAGRHAAKWSARVEGTTLVSMQGYV